MLRWLAAADLSLRARLNLSMHQNSLSSGDIDQFLSSIVLSLYDMTRPDGSCHSFPIPVLSDSVSVHAVLGDQARFVKSLGLLGAWGDSRFNTHGAEWELRRALTQRAYLSAGAEQKAGQVGEIYDARLAAADVSLAGIQRALMLAASETFLAAFDCEADLVGLLELFERARPHVKRLQFFTWRAPSAAERDALSEESQAITRAFGQIVGQSPSMLNLLASLDAAARDIVAFDPVHELLMNFFAAIETTAATLCFAIDRLGLSTSVQDRLHEDILNDNDVHLNCFINETLRCFPTVPFVVRQAVEETRLGGAVVARGQAFLISIVGLHHDPRAWGDAHVFDASRKEFLTDSYDRRAFLPFLAGPRMCGGARLARLELREGLKAFLRRFSVTNDSVAVGLDYGITLRPRALGRMTFSRRS